MLPSLLTQHSFAFSLLQKLFSVTSFAPFPDYLVIVFTTHRERTLLRSSVGCYSRCAAAIEQNCSTRLMPFNEANLLERLRLAAGPKCHVLSNV